MQLEPCSTVILSAAARLLLVQGSNKAQMTTVHSHSLPPTAWWGLGQHMKTLQQMEPVRWLCTETADCQVVKFTINVSDRIGVLHYVKNSVWSNVYYAPSQWGALSDDGVWRLSRKFGCRVACAAGQLDGAYWLIRLGRPGSRLLLRTSVAGLGEAYRGGREPTACLKFLSVWPIACECTREEGLCANCIL